MNTPISIKYTALTGDFVIKQEEYGTDITARDEQSIVKNFYDFDLSKSSLLFDFLKTDIIKPESILDFYRKYGLLGKPYTSKEEPRPDVFKKQVILCRVILELHSACENQQIQEAVHALFVLTYLHYDHALISSEITNILQPFYNTFPKSHTRRIDQPYLTATLPRYVHAREYVNSSKKPTIVYDYASNQLSVAFSIEKYFKNLTLTQSNDIYACSMQACASILSDALKDVHIETVFQGGKLSVGWVAENLRSLIFYELAQRLTSGDVIRRCACKTCREYFTIYSNDMRKIYCSTHCAQLEAKRKQRERQKKEGVINGQH